MRQLFEGVIAFQREGYAAHRELFEGLSRCQKPHTLFIGCSDSRLIPTMLTGAQPGELFMIRNVANLVPPYRQTEEFVATTSAIEYAVQVLGVENILVCGHSNCGGCCSLLSPIETQKHIPHVLKWMQLADPVREELSQPEYADLDIREKEWMAERLNVILQLEHLKTYPYIREKLDAGQIKLIGWHYIIETGEVYNYDAKSGHFELIEESKL
jgi:carbonic anhydrase